MVFTTWKDRSKMQMQIITKEFKYDINFGLLLGRRGENIKLIQSTTNTHISIIREDKNIIITAYCKENIENAMKLIVELRENNQMQNFNENNRMQNFNENNRMQNEFKLNSEDFPSLN